MKACKSYSKGILVSLQSKMFILPALRVALIAIFFYTDAVKSFPEVEYCLQQSSSLSGENGSSSMSFTFEGNLSKEFGHSIACQMKNDANASFLYIIGHKNSTGSLQVTVFNSEMAQTIARLEVTRDDNSSHSLVCLDTTSQQGKGNKYVVISGTPKLEFKVKIQFITNELMINNTGASFQGPKIFQFWPGKQKQSSRREAQLDITVQSDTLTKGILTVSHYCSQTEKLDKNIIDFSKPSIFLTFSKRGRITLSRVSTPNFNRNVEEPYFISVLPTPDTNFAKYDKLVNIKLGYSFDYDYSQPICFIIFVSFFGGIFISFWALKCFKEPLVLVSLNTSKHSLGNVSTSGNGASVSFKSRKFFDCCGGESEDNELRPLLHPEADIPSTYKQLLRAMLTVMRYHWVGKGRKTFSYITCIVGFVLIVGAFQFVYVNWSVMVDSGDRDKCFYNDWCYRVGVNDIPFNLMISNLSYMIHGIILAWSIWVMEAELYIQARKKALVEYKKPSKKPDEGEQLPRHTLICSNLHVHLPELSVPEFNCDEDKTLEIFTRAYKKKYSFSIGYAFAWALIFEGLFSLTYHLCPSRLTFQFDSAFMFVIAGLIVVSLFNGLSVKECQKETGNPRPVEDTTFFLFIIVPLYILNYLGSLYNKYGNGKNLHISVYVIFCVAMVLWYVMTFLWSCNKLFHSSIKNGFHTFESKVKAVLFVLTVVTNCIILPSFLNRDISNLLLFSTIVAALASSIGKVTINAYKATTGTVYKMSFSTIALRIFQGSYIISAIVIMSVAIYLFEGIPTSQKTAPPDVSRNLNKECLLLHFYDAHDVWHILSSFGLLMGAFLVMYISE